jgi:hypothetical protein
MEVINTLYYGDFEYRLPDDYPVDRFANAIFEAREAALAHGRRTAVLSITLHDGDTLTVVLGENIPIGIRSHQQDAPNNRQ